MLIKVLKTTKASKNELGIETFEYLEGETYDIYQELAEVFIKQGWGISIENKEEISYLTSENEIENSIEEKTITDENLENKAINNLENKGIKSKKGNKNAK